MLDRSRSNSAPRGRAKSASPSRMRGRSGSPSRHSLRGGGSNHGPPTLPTRRGRSRSPSSGSVHLPLSRGSTRSRSVDASRMNGSNSSRGHPLSSRGRSTSPSRNRSCRSRTPSAMNRERSNSPSQMRGRSQSPTQTPSRSRSRSSERRSLSPGSGRGGTNGKIRKGGRRPVRSLAKAPKKLYKGVRRTISKRDECPTSQLLAYAIPIFLLLASIAGLVIATGNASKITPDFLGDLVPRLRNEDMVDPFAQKTQDGIIARWRTSGNNGLTVTILNAMSTDWDRFLNLVVTDWDYGNPDALTLNVERVAEDKSDTCPSVEGKIKVCSRDYGEKKWRGINTANWDANGFITSTSAQLNEFYLNFDGDDAKQYTLCHELGHAFGLAHTDEIFGNPDLGNCLDYTNNFHVNKQPDTGLYETLLLMYGPVGGQRWLRRGPEDETEPLIPEAIRTKMDHATRRLAARRDDKAYEDGWKLLHRTEYGEEHELEFEGGYKVHVSMLLA